MFERYVLIACSVLWSPTFKTAVILQSSYCKPGLEIQGVSYRKGSNFEKNCEEKYVSVTEL